MLFLFKIKKKKIQKNKNLMKNDYKENNNNKKK